MTDVLIAPLDGTPPIAARATSRVISMLGFTSMVGPIRSLRSSFSQAEANDIIIVAILGNREFEAGALTLRNVTTREQITSTDADTLFNFVRDAYLEYLAP